STASTGSDLAHTCGAGGAVSAARPTSCRPSDPGVIRVFTNPVPGTDSSARATRHFVSRTERPTTFQFDLHRLNHSQTRDLPDPSLSVALDVLPALDGRHFHEVATTHT